MMHILWAQANPLHSMGRNFREGGARFQLGEVLLWGLALLVVVIVVALVIHYFSRRQAPGYRNPRLLFLELCKAHGFDRTRRGLLWQLAREQRLADPARLFLEPERFEAANLGPALAGKTKELQRLRDMMFGKRLKLN